MTLETGRQCTYKKKRKTEVGYSTVLIAFICFLLVLPEDVFAWLPLYKSETPSSIAYKWLNYRFGVIQLVVFLIGVLYAFKLKKYGGGLFVLLMLIRELFFTIFSDKNIFATSSYEMYLSAFIGFAFVLWAEGGLKTFDSCERFFKWFLVTNMLTLYINLAMGGNGGMLSGRYHSSNLDVGGTGTLCVLCVLYIAFGNTKKWYDFCFIGLSVIGLFLSGSRANLVFLILMLAISYGYRIILTINRKENHVQRKRLLNRLLLSILAIVVLAIVIITNYSTISNWILGSRFQFLFTSGSVRSDDSVLGRTASVIAGLDVIKNHPFGISGYFINLQQEVVMRGYPTFPHSTFISMYIIFGPVLLIIYVMWIKLLNKLRVIDIKYFLVILYLFISTSVYGGPIVNFKIVFMITMATHLAKWAVLCAREDSRR